MTFRHIAAVHGNGTVKFGLLLELFKEQQVHRAQQVLVFKVFKDHLVYKELKEQMAYLVRKDYKETKDRMLQFILKQILQ